jgi:hypothetical protein
LGNNGLSAGVGMCRRRVPKDRADERRSDEFRASRAANRAGGSRGTKRSPSVMLAPAAQVSLPATAQPTAPAPATDTVPASLRDAAAAIARQYNAPTPVVHDGRVDRAAARRIEDQFLAAFRTGIGRIEALPHPAEGSIYDLNPGREHIRDWDEREEARRQLLRAGNGASAADMPSNRGVHVSIVRRPLFGAPSARISVVAACWSPLPALARGVAVAQTDGAGMAVVDEILDRALVHERRDVWHFIGICSVTGWEERLREPLPSGVNWSLALVEPRPPGWKIHTPAAWPGELSAAFDPDTPAVRYARVTAVLRSAGELQRPGGLLMLDEIAERAAVSREFAFGAARDFTAQYQEFVLRDISGSIIVTRRQ